MAINADERVLGDPPLATSPRTERRAMPAESKTVPLPEQESDFMERGFVRVLDREARDLEHKLLRAGAAVLCHPLAPDDFLENTPANRARFLALDCAWTEKLRQRIWFPEMAGLSQGLLEHMDRVRSAKSKFFAAIQANMAGSLRSPFPQVRAAGWLNLLPYEWEPKIKQAAQVADLTDRYFAAVRASSGARADLAWPPEWESLAKGLNPVRVYEVAGFRSRVHVVAGFVARFGIQRQAEPQILPLDQASVDAVQEVYRQWLAEQAGSGPDFAFFTLGASGALPANLAGLAAADHWLTLAGLPDAGQWELRLPPPFSYRPSLRDFLDRMKPESRDQRLSRVKDCVDGLLIEGGNVTVDRVKRDSGYRRSSVREAFFDLQKRAPESYRVWTKDGQLAIRKTRAGEPIKFTSANTGPQLLRRHGLRLGSLAVGATVSVLGSEYQRWLGVSGTTGFMLAVPILYVGSCLQATINRRADKEGE